MHSRVAAAMRAGVEHLTARSGRSRPPRFRMFRLFKLFLLLLGAFAVGLYVAAAFDLGRLPQWRATPVAPGGFTRGSRSNRTNCVVDGDTIHYEGTKIRIEG